MKRFFTPSLALSLLALAGPAGAQITQRAEPRASEEASWFTDFQITDAQHGNYAVEFKADALDATLMDGSVPRIVVRPTHAYGMLLRPRTHFVPELLKSVEVM